MQCRNKRPAVVPFLTTRRTKSADLHEPESSPPSDFILSFVTVVEEKEAVAVDVRELLDAIEGIEVEPEAINFGTKCDDDDNETICTFIYKSIILV